MYALSNKHYNIVSSLENKGATKHITMFENDVTVAHGTVEAKERDWDVDDIGGIKSKQYFDIKTVKNL